MTVSTMKDYMSRFLKTIAMGYMAFPIAYLLLSAILFNIPGRECLRILLSPSFYVLSFMAAVTGYGIWEMRRWSWYLFLFTNLLILYTNAVLVSNFGQSAHKLIAFLFSAILLVAISYRVGREMRVPYFLPRIRWWESNPRYKLNVPVKIRVGEPTELEIDGEILDLSMGGCFIKTRTELDQDQTIAVEFEVFGLPVHATGNVVWRTQSTVTHPKGIGVKFAALLRPQRRYLKAITQRLKKIASFYRSSRYLVSQEEFSKRYDELSKTRLMVSRGKLRRIGATDAPK